MPEVGGSEATLRHYLAVLRRRWPVVAMIAALACATAYLLTNEQKPVYEATSSVLLQPLTSEQLLVGSGGTTAAASVFAAETQIEVMTSQVVTDAVTAKLGRPPKVRLQLRGRTDVVDIRARSFDPTAAAVEATTFAEVYVELRRTQRVDDLAKTGELIRSQLAQIDEKLTALEAPVRAVDNKLASLPASASPAAAAERTNLQQKRAALADQISGERKSLEDRRSAFDDQLNRLQLLAGLGTSGGVQLVSRAAVPTSPVSASPFRNGALGLVGGLIAGLALAFLLDQLDDRLLRKDELESATKGIPVLGLLPRLGRSHRAGPVALNDPTSAAAESYRTLRTSLQFLSLDRPIRSLQVTSAGASEGKTTTIANLGASFAQAGKRVIVLDCDLRRSRVHEAFGLSNERGFTSVLLGESELMDVVTLVDGEPNLAVVPAGPAPPNPAELLASSRAIAILRTLAENCDILLVDTPPVLPVTDALVISGNVDALLLLAQPKQTTKRQVTRAYELLRQVGAPVIGTILNGVEDTTGYGSGYGTRGGYGEIVRRKRPLGRTRRAEREPPATAADEPAEDEPAEDGPNADAPNAHAHQPDADERNADERTADEVDADEPNAHEPDADEPDADGPDDAPQRSTVTQAVEKALQKPEPRAEDTHVPEAVS